MSVFKPPSPIPEKPVIQHPWENRIKYLYFNKIKYAHNSIHNPESPKKEKKACIAKKVTPVKFTVIGDRVTEEFIYCAELVKGLHKYRSNKFEAPTIKGVTTVEWPMILNDLKMKYHEAYCLSSSVAVLVNDKFLGGETDLRKLVESTYNYYLVLNYHKESIAQFAKFVKSTARPFVYMSIAIDNEPIGHFIFMLYADILPQTCDNFLRLCKENKGGYSGTPIHRIVKDGWIQGGGFGLKETNLDCENFIIPHDRRGVLCMANAGLVKHVCVEEIYNLPQFTGFLSIYRTIILRRHLECSTQFFVLLQPSPWMANKFVAFGQLVEGKRTLDTIEAVPTFYESPTSDIRINKTGIFNMDCHDIMINKGANQYIDKHIEDLNDLGERLYKMLMEKVFLTAQLRELDRLKEQEGEGGEKENKNEDKDEAAGLRATQRFNRRKEEIEKQLQISKGERPTTTTINRQIVSAIPPLATNENNDFDVETYDPEYEEADYQHQSLGTTPSLIVKPRKPFYIPLTDVLYPEEKDSHFDLKRFLQGDYCLLSDLKEGSEEMIIPDPDLFVYDKYIEDEEGSGSDVEDESVDHRKKDHDVRTSPDRLSFAGGKLKHIAKCENEINIFAQLRNAPFISDDQLRRLRLATAALKKHLEERKVSIREPDAEDLEHRKKIKRRHTGFPRPDENFLQKYSGVIADEDDVDDDDDRNVNERKVKIAPTALGKPGKVKRRPTPFARPTNIQFEDTDDGYNDDDDDNSDDDEGEQIIRKSVLNRLFDEVKGTDSPPTLKCFNPYRENYPKNFLTHSDNLLKSDDEDFKRVHPHISLARESYDQVLDMQHGKKMTRKMSLDYVNTFDQMERTLICSIRSAEYAKTRPSLSISEYQRKNRMYAEAHKMS